MTTNAVTSIEQKFQNFINQHDIESIIHNHIVAGGNLVELCEMHGFPYYFLTDFINSNEDIRTAFDQACEFRKEHAAERVLNEITELCTFNVADMYTDEGEIKHIKDMPVNLQKAIKSIDMKNGKIVFADRLKAIQTLLQTTNLLNIKVTHEAGSSLEQLIGSSFKIPEKTGEVKSDE